MKQSEIKGLSAAELQEELSKSQKGYVDLTMAHAMSPLDNPLQLRKERRSIARIKTELTKRELNG